MFLEVLPAAWLGNFLPFGESAPAFDDFSDDIDVYDDWNQESNTEECAKMITSKTEEKYGAETD